MALGFGSGIACVLAIVAWRGCHSGKRIMDTVIGYLKEMGVAAWDGRILYAIVALMGVNIAVWLASGVVAQLIVAGVGLAERFDFLTLSFVLMALLSFMMGTSLGAVSTLGIALLGIGTGIGLPKPMLLGAIISGAYLADRLSPLSGLVNLTLTTMKIDYKSFFRSSMKSLLPALILTGIIYTIINPDVAVGLSGIDEVREGLSTAFELNFILMAVPLLMVVMAIIGQPILVSMALSVILSSAACIFLQGFSPLELITCWWSGFALDTGNPAIDQLAKGGGLQPMMEIVLIIIFALSLSRLFTVSGILLPLGEKMVAISGGRKGMKVGISLNSIFFTSVACDQSLGILIPPILYGKEAEKSGIDKVEFARIVADSGTIIAPIEFWNLNAIVILSITGVSAMDYGPYAYMCFLLPIMTNLITLASPRKEVSHEHQNDHSL